LKVVDIYNAGFLDNLGVPRMTTSEANIFDNIYKKDYLGFTDNNGFDYAEVAQFIDFDSHEISKIAGVSKKSVRFDHKIPQEVKDRLTEIANICLLVAEQFRGDKLKTALWFKSPNPMLGNLSPRDMIRLGKYKKLMLFILDAIESTGGKSGEENQNI